MRAVIGLGNLGKKYENTRHNVGFMLLDRIREKYAFPDFKLEKKFQAEISVGNANLRSVKSEKIILVKPQTFMNLSGQSVRSILDFYKLSPDDILVIHDDLDFELGKYKISTDSRSAGHNGVQNIIDQLGTQKFKRIRIGIGKDVGTRHGVFKSCRIGAHDFVLQKFSSEELEKLEKAFGEILEKEIEI